MARQATASDLRCKILEEAIGIVYREGTERVTMRALGDKLGYSPATIYLYFRNKEELLVEIARYGYERLAERCLPPLEADDVLEALRSSANAYLDFAFENAALYQLMFRMLPPASQDPDSYPMGTRLAEASARLYQRGREQGVLLDRDVELNEAVFSSALHGFLDLALTGRLPRRGTRRSLRALRGEVVESMLGAISVPR